MECVAPPEFQCDKISGFLCPPSDANFSAARWLDSCREHIMEPCFIAACNTKQGYNYGNGKVLCEPFPVWRLQEGNGTVVYT